MENKINAVLEKISQQQEKLTKENVVYWVGEQLKEIASESETNAELVLADLDNPNMSIKELEKAIKTYAREHGNCTPPKVADEIIREFYGLPPKAEAPAKSDAPKILNLEDLI